MTQNIQMRLVDEVADKLRSMAKAEGLTPAAFATTLINEAWRTTDAGKAQSATARIPAKPRPGLQVLASNTYRGKTWVAGWDGEIYLAGHVPDTPEYAQAREAYSHLTAHSDMPVIATAEKLDAWKVRVDAGEFDHVEDVTVIAKREAAEAAAVRQRKVDDAMAAVKAKHGDVTVGSLLAEMGDAFVPGQTTPGGDA